MVVDRYAQAGSMVAAVLVGEGEQHLWGMTLAERLCRTVRQAGLSESPAPATHYLLLRADHVFDPVLVRRLAEGSPAVLVNAQGRPAAALVPAGDAANVAALLQNGQPLRGLPLLTVEGLAGTYDPRLRKRWRPYVVSLADEGAAAAEQATFGGSYKGVTDLVTKYLWPRPALVVTRWCAEHRIGANTVTTVSLLLVVVAWVLFWNGAFAAGLIAAWAMTFLDTVDGKLARVTLSSTRFGNLYDHGIDLLHPPFWYWAWMHGAQPVPQAEIALLVIIGGYVLQRIAEGLFLAVFKLEMHVWRPFDSWFRLITARRNPNLLILTAGVLAGRPDIGILAVAAWTAASLLVHLTQLVQAALHSRHGQVMSWMAR